MRRFVGIIACLLAQAGTGVPESPVAAPSQPPKGLKDRYRGPNLSNAMEFDRLRTEGIRAYVEKDYKEAARYFQAALALRPGDEVTQAWLRAAKYKIAVPDPKPSALPSGLPSGPPQMGPLRPQPSLPSGPQGAGSPPPAGGERPTPPATPSAPLPTPPVAPQDPAGMPIPLLF